MFILVCFIFCIFYFSLTNHVATFKIDVYLEILNYEVEYYTKYVLFICIKLTVCRDLELSSGELYFTKFLMSFWDMYVLMTTANSPDIM